MGFRPDVQPTAAISRFKPDAPSVSTGAEDILGDARMSELSANPAAPLQGTSKPLDVGYGERLGAAGGKAAQVAAQKPATVPVGLLESVASMLTGGVSLAPGAVDTLLGRLGVSDPQNPTNDLATAKAKYTYEPRTDYGQAVNEQFGALMHPVGELAEKGGEMVGGVTGSRQVGSDFAASAPDLFGAALGLRGARGPKPAAAVEDAATVEGRAKLADIRKQGIKVTPKEASQITGDKNYVGRALQAIGGDTKVSKDMAAVNRPVINEMGRKAVGSESLTEKGLAPIKDAGNAAYQEMASLGPVAPGETLRASVEKARGAASKSTKRNTDIDQFVDGVLNELGGEAVDAGQIVNRVRELRRDAANSRKGEGDKRPTVQQEALGTAQRQVADALDDFLELSAATAGKPKLAERYKENRTRLAKVGTVEGASRAGNLNAKQLYEARRKGAPLSGKLSDVAEAHEYAPESTAPAAVESLMDAPGRNLSLTDLLLAAPQAAARHMGVNKLLQSDLYQNMIGGKAGGPHLPEHDPNPNAFGRTAPPPAGPPAPQVPTPPPGRPSINFEGELGLVDEPAAPVAPPPPGPSVAAPAAKRVTGYRGVPEGVDPFDSSNTHGNALFFTPDEATARTYGSNVASRDLEFSNLLETPGDTLETVRQALGLNDTAELLDIIAAARDAGHDGVTYDLKPGREYIQIPPKKKP